MMDISATELAALDEYLADLLSVAVHEQLPSDGGAKRPRLICMLPLALNPFVESADEHTTKWACEHGIIHPLGTRFDRFRAARFSWLAARAYPRASEEQLKLVSDWITFLFCYDDMCDSAAVLGERYQAELQSTELRLIDIVHGAAQGSGDNWLENALRDIRARVAAVDDAWMPRFARHFTQYVEGVRWERLIRLRGETPTMPTYTKLRVLTSAVQPCFDFAGLFIPTLTVAAVTNTYLQQLELIANNYICWINDIFGIEKELREGTTCNMVLVLRRSVCESMEAAIDRTVDLCNDELKAFAELEQDIAKLTEIGEPERDYIAALRAWMRGNLDWYADTARYGRARSSDESPSSCWSPELRHLQSEPLSGFLRSGASR